MSSKTKKNQWGKEKWYFFPISIFFPHGQCCIWQSWAHRSYKLSDRSKAMSDPWFSKRRKMSAERWANCKKKEFAHRSKRSLNLKERAFWAVRSLSDVTMFLGFIESDEWFSPFSLSEPLVERRAFERRAKREIQKLNAWASAIQGKKSGERIANLGKMSECPAL